MPIKKIKIQTFSKLSILRVENTFCLHEITGFNCGQYIVFSNNRYLFHEFCNYNFIFTHNTSPHPRPLPTTHDPRHLATLPQITQVSLTSDEAGCYHNNFLLAVVTDAGKRFGLTVTQYDFSEPQYGKDVCDRILSPTKSAIRRYCCEGNDVLSAKDMRTALSERPVRGTIACVCLVNETQKHLR